MLNTFFPSYYIQDLTNLDADEAKILGALLKQTPHQTLKKGHYYQAQLEGKIIFVILPDDVIKRYSSSIKHKNVPRWEIVGKKIAEGNSFVYKSKGTIKVNDDLAQYSAKHNRIIKAVVNRFFSENERAITELVNHHSKEAVPYGEDKTAIVMPDYGVSFSELLEQKDTFQSTEAISLAFMFMNGVSAMHNKEVVHHDIKTDNTFLYRKKATVKLIDFGASARENLNEGDQRIRTKYYTAPEYFSHDQRSKDSDIFSAGVVLLEIFSSTAYASYLEKKMNVLKVDSLAEYLHHPSVGLENFFMEFANCCLQTYSIYEQNVIIDVLKRSFALDRSQRPMSVEISCMFAALGIVNVANKYNFDIQAQITSMSFSKELMNAFEVINLLEQKEMLNKRNFMPLLQNLLSSSINPNCELMARFIQKNLDNHLMLKECVKNLMKKPEEFVEDLLDQKNSRTALKQELILRTKKTEHAEGESNQFDTSLPNQKFLCKFFIDDLKNGLLHGYWDTDDKCIPTKKHGLYCTMFKHRPSYFKVIDKFTKDMVCELLRLFKFTGAEASLENAKNFMQNANVLIQAVLAAQKKAEYYDSKILAQYVLFNQGKKDDICSLKAEAIREFTSQNVRVLAAM